MSRRLGLWILAAPLLFVLHEAEEYRTMLPWLAEHESIIPKAIRSFIPRDPAFIAYAGVFFLMVFLIVGVWAVRSRPLSAAWIVLAALFAARLENAVLHTIESIVFFQYTPGVLTAVLIVLPVTSFLLWQMLRQGLIRSSWLPGIVVAGFVAQSTALIAMFLLG
jgi:hypothetical protein